MTKFVLGGICAIALTLAMTASASGATFVVTQSGDPAPGACNANCSLREAVIAANARPGADVARLGTGTRKLVRAIALEDASATGDLDVTDDLTIAGRSPGRSVIDGEWAAIADPLITVHPGASLAVRKATIRDGNSTDDYSAIDFLGTADSLRLTNVRVVSNVAQYSAVASGGFSFFRKVLFKRNTATGCCPALYNLGDGEMRLTDVVFDRNVANDDTGAFYSDGDVLVANRVTFSRNRAGDTAGGAMIASSGTNKLNNVTFSQNRTTGDAGALRLESDAILNNVTFFRNVADSNSDEPPGQGGAIFGTAGTATASNTIFVGNTEGGDGANQCGGDAFVSANNNLIGPAFGCMFAAAPNDVMLGSRAPGLRRRLRRNGGFAPSHALRRSSPAVNKGSNATCEPRDQRGVRRPQGRRCDIGAFELELP